MIMVDLHFFQWDSALKNVGGMRSPFADNLNVAAHANFTRTHIASSRRTSAIFSPMIHA